ncbi:hypothetical protein HZH66_015342 [Vespula vulgaris]|uniref:Uncharacterized protein n=1 Tax=Vespula vulgaris TaxID=7454 RepID=A0A834MM33_VESVU|nr:hypothetical protein HZH66_015342 [Vespula vulgaris]
MLMPNLPAGSPATWPATLPTTSAAGSAPARDQAKCQEEAEEGEEEEEEEEEKEDAVAAAVAKNVRLFEVIMTRNTAKRTVAIEPGVSFPCNRIAMLILPRSVDTWNERALRVREPSCRPSSSSRTGAVASPVSASSPNTLYRELRCCRGVVPISSFFELAPSELRSSFSPLPRRNDRHLGSER